MNLLNRKVSLFSSESTSLHLQIGESGKSGNLRGDGQQVKEMKNNLHAIP